MTKKINAAFIGCGMFAKAIHLPSMGENQKYRLYAACDIIEESAKEVCEKYKMRTKNE